MNTATKKFISWYLLSLGQINRARFFLCLLIIGACFEAIGVAAVVPLVNIYSGDDLQSYINLFQNINIDLNSFDKAYLQLLLLGMLSAVIVLSIVFRLISNYILLKFGLEREFYLSTLIFKKLIHKNLSWHNNNSMTEVKRAIISEVNTTVNAGLISYLTIFSQTCVACLIFCILLIYNPTVAISAILISIVCYMGLYFSIKDKLHHNGRLRFSSNDERFRVIDNTFTSPKVVLANQLENKMTQEFSSGARTYSHSQVVVQVLKQLPRYAFEALTFAILLSSLAYGTYVGLDPNNFAPTLLVFVFAWYRALPAVQQIYSSKTQFDASKPSIQMIYQFLEDNFNEKILNDSTDNKITFNESVSFKNVYFCYENKDLIFSDFSCIIKKGEMVGICGESGSGKTTFVDLICGLLTPSNGKIFADDKEINHQNRSMWLKNISYVSQFPLIFNDSIIENIVLNQYDKSKIDSSRLEKCWRAACLDEFLDYDSVLNDDRRLIDNGSQLSGGQRQRISLARALYREASIIILDEATNALDIELQNKVLESLRLFSKTITIIIISHQSEVLDFCSQKIYIKSLANEGKK